MSSNTNAKRNAAAAGWKAVFGSKKQKAVKDFTSHRYASLIKPETEPVVKVVAWNVNGLRAVLKKNLTDFEAYVACEDPDILCLSETKLQTENSLDQEICTNYPFKTWSCATAKKGYSGTAIFSKKKPLSKQTVLLEKEKEGRFIALEFDSFWLVHCYVPNSGQKLERLEYRTKTWDAALLEKILELEKSKPVVWCGDLNVAHLDIDVHNPKGNTAGFTDAERDNFTRVLDAGFVDVYRERNPEKTQFTFWSYRANAKAQNKGWRLDYFLTSKSMVDRVIDIRVRDNVSGSDHCPITMLLKPSDEGASY